MNSKLKEMKELEKRENRLDLIRIFFIFLALIFGGIILALIVSAVVFIWGYKERKEISRLKKEINYRSSGKPFKVGGFLMVFFGIAFLILSLKSPFDKTFFIFSIIIIVLGVLIYLVSKFFKR